MRGKEAWIWLTHRRRVRIFLGISFRHSMEWCKKRNDLKFWKRKKKISRQKRRVERFRSIGLIYADCGGCSSCSWMLGNARYNFHNLIETLSPTMKGECSAQSFRGVIGSPGA